MPVTLFQINALLLQLETLQSLWSFPVRVFHPLYPCSKDSNRLSVRMAIKLHDLKESESEVIQLCLTLGPHGL